MAYKYHLVSISSDICEDNYEKGIGNSTGCGYNNHPIGRTFGTFQEMIKFLSSMFGLPGDEIDYEVEKNCLYTSKTVANHCESQNGGWFEATETEIKAWAKGKMKLYSEDFTINFLRCG